MKELSRRDEAIARFRERVASDLAGARAAVAAAIEKMTGSGASLAYQVSWGRGVAEDVTAWWLAEFDEHLAKLERGKLAGAKTIDALIEYHLKQTRDKAMRVDVSSSMFATAVALVHQDVAKSMYERFSFFKLELDYADKEDAELAAEAKAGIARKTLAELKAAADDAALGSERTRARKTLAAMRALLRDHGVAEKNGRGPFWVRDGEVLGYLPKDDLAGVRGIAERNSVDGQTP